MAKGDKSRVMGIGMKAGGGEGRSKGLAWVCLRIRGNMKGIEKIIK